MRTPAERPGALRSLARALRSWRTAAVALLSFASGLPLGLVWIAIPDWMRSVGVDIRVVGLITLAQAPWTFKFLWSPLMDRYRAPFWGRRRGWIALAQVSLFACTLALAGLGDHPDTPWVVAALALAIAFASATQDIAYDAYTVDVLTREEQGPAVGARTAIYRAAMYFAGAFSITLAGLYSWPLVLALLAFLYLPFLLVTWKAPEETAEAPPPASLREAVWRPFVAMLARPRALQILAFVVCYKLGDNLAQALLRPFLVDMGYDAVDRGVALGTGAMLGYSGGALLGGLLTGPLGLGRALWIFGLIQIVSNVGYIFVAESPVNRPLMYGAMSFESFTQGLGTGAFGVLLLRLTEKRFSATQYALLSSLFGIPRVVTGPISGFAVDAMGWTAFFWLTMVVALPGLLLLSRFVPWGAREPRLEVAAAPMARRPLGRGGLAARATAGAVLGTVGGALLSAALSALKAMRATPPRPFDLGPPLAEMLRPATAAGWVAPIGVLVFGLVCGLVTAAVVAARRGTGQATS